jgi:hypothetical protein
MHYITTKTLIKIKVLLLTGTLLIVALVLYTIFSGNSEPGLIGRKGSKLQKPRKTLRSPTISFMHGYGSYRIWTRNSHR